MKKRLMSVLLVLLMVFSLLPAAALAAEANPNPEPVHDNGLYLKKTFDPDTDTLTIEAYSEAEKIIHDEAVPCDIVLVLDVSGSMEDTMSEDTWTEVTQDFSYNTIEGYSTNEYFIEFEGQRYQVHAVEVHAGFGILFPHYTWLYFERGNTRYYLKGNQIIQARDNAKAPGVIAGLIISNPRDTQGWIGNEITGANGEPTTVWSGTLWKHSTETTRIVAMQNAVKNFIDNVKIDADNNSVNHRISIVKFAGNRSTAVGNNRYNSGGYTYNYSQIMRGLTAVGGENNNSAQQLKNLVDAIIPGGATRADFGMEFAGTVMGSAAAGSNKVVVMFTDGEPTSGSSFERDVANSAVGYSKQLKDAGAKVYTVGVFDNAVTNNTKQYMNAVSSNYPNATSYNVGDTRFYGYSMTASNPDELNDIFTKISESEISGGVSLDADTIIRDVMKGGAFELRGVTAASHGDIKVYTAPCIGMNGDERVFDENRTPAGGITVSVNDASQTVDVTGFDFADNWCGPDPESASGVHGKKIIIEIPAEPAVGAEGVVDTNEGVSGIYDDDGTLVKPFPVPSYEIPTASYVIDFNAPVTVASNTTRMKGNPGVNGVFALTGTNVTYQLKNTETIVDGANLSLSGVDSALIRGQAYGRDSVRWTNIVTVPANNVYFDDALLNHAALTYLDGSGYNAGVGSDVSSGAGVINADGAKQLFFTFTGTGIDVYCTTDTAGGYVQAALLSGAEQNPANLIDGTRFAVRNYAETTRYNVPTVSYSGLDYGTYTVYIWAMAGSEYKLDGVRIYNPMQDQSVYEGTNEANASFFNLRENLLNNGESVVFTDDPTKDYLADNEVTILGENPGVLFIDDVDSVELKIEETGEAVYSNAYEAYVANGPKNEIYLSANQGVAFKLADGLAADHYWLGLSTPDAGSAAATVLVNGKAVEPVISSAVDMYYPITPDADGNVVVVNQGGGMVALTNLKVTRDNPAEDDGAQPFGLLSVKSLKMAANSSASGQDDGGNPGMQELIRQLISSFVKALFNSISRLFGK